LDEHARRLAQNEAMFRELNEQIKDAAQGMQATLIEPFSFFCECGDLGCEERIPLSLLEYEAIRAAPTTFAVVRGHERLEAERVVQTHPSYLMVEKMDEAAEEARRRDPRR
jgi:hypothetical protein